MAAELAEMPVRRFDLLARASPALQSVGSIEATVMDIKFSFSCPPSLAVEAFRRTDVTNAIGMPWQRSVGSSHSLGGERIQSCKKEQICVRHNKKDNNDSETNWNASTQQTMNATLPTHQSIS